MLTELADHAFSPGGPVERILGQYRPVQAKIAHQFASFVEANRGSPHTTVSLNEQRGGLGKTAAYAVVLMLDISLTGERAAFATFTRGLRNSIREQAEVLNSIIQETLEDNGIAYRAVNIVEVQSPTAMVSPTKCEAIRTLLEERRIALDDITEVQEFLDGFDQAERPCEFADLYAVLPSLPCGWTELTLSMCPQDRGTEDWRTVQLSRQQASNPRTLILLTHAMVIRNNLRKGKLFQDTEDDDLGVKTLVIDEADKLPGVANSALRFSVSRNELAELARDAEIASPGSGRQLDVGLTRVRDLLIRMDSYQKDDPNALRLSEAFGGINYALINIMRTEAADDLLLADRIRLYRDNVRALAKMAEFEHPVMRVTRVADPTGQPDIHVTLEIGGGRQLINQMWRGEHSFETISMVSALMTDMPPHADRYLRFRRDIALDRTQGDKFIEQAPLHPRYGGITSVFVADRVASLLPTDTEEVNLLRVTSLDGLAAQIITAAKRRTQRERMVVLFQSYIALHEVLGRLTPDIRARVVTRNRRHLPIAIEDFAYRPFGIWFGVEWEGINFVDPRTRRTLVNALIITRMPLAPRDDIRAARIDNAIQKGKEERYERGQMIALFESVHAAYRKLYHGIVMGIRSADDMIDELWILDPRWPVPGYVYQRQPPVIIRALPQGNIFSNFDRSIDPYDVRNWYKVDAEGAIETILEPAEA